MKLKIAASDFSDIISRAHLFSAYDASHPAFSMTLIEVTKSSNMRVSVANQISGCRMSAAAEGEQGRVCIPTKQLDRLVNGMPKDGQLRMVVSNKAKFAVGKSFSAVLPVQDPDDFVKLDDPPKDGWFEVDINELKETITATEWAAGTDYEHYPVLTGIHMCPEYTEASDGHCMARRSPGIVPAGVDMVVPSAMLGSVKVMLAREEGKVRMANTGNIWMRGFGWAVYVQPVAEEYFKIGKYMYDVDDSGKAEIVGGKVVDVNSIHLAAPQIRDAVRRTLAASGGSAVRFQMKKDVLTMTSLPDEDKKNALRISQRLDWSDEEVNPGRFDDLAAWGYDPSYLSKALGPMKGDTVKVLWSNKESLQLHDDNGMQAAVMPIRLQG